MRVSQQGEVEEARHFIPSAHSAEPKYQGSMFIYHLLKRGKYCQQKGFSVFAGGTTTNKNGGDLVARGDVVNEGGVRVRWRGIWDRVHAKNVSRGERRQYCRAPTTRSPTIHSARTNL